MTFLRPLAWRPALLLLCLAAGMAVGAEAWWPPLGVALALMCEGWRAKGVGIAAVLLGIALRPMEPPRVMASPKGVFTVRVATLPRAVNAGSSFLAELPNGARLVAFAEGRGLGLGDVVRVEGTLVPLQRGPDDYLVSRRVAGRLRIRRLERIARGSRWSAWLTEVSDGVQARLERRLGERRGRLVGAVGFNFDGLLDDPATDVLRRSGAYHLVSASGMHVQIIAGLVLALGLWIPVPRWAWILFSALLLLLYSVLTGWHAATLRSTLMWTVAALAYTGRRGEDGLSALGLFGSLWLVVNPADLYDPGFTLTMIVTAAIVTVPRGEGLTKLGLRGGLAAWIASEPLLLLMTGRLLPLAFPANIALGLVSVVVLVAGLATGLLPGVLGDLAAIPAGWSADGLMLAAQAFGNPAFSQVSLPAVASPLLVVAIYALFAGGWLAFESRRCPLPPP